MNDERFLKEWLQDDAPEPSGARKSADQIMARLPETKQRSRLWPLVPSRRSTSSPSDDGEPRSVSGRTRSMFSPAKAITAAAVFALGGVLLIAQPFDQPGDISPGAEPPGSGATTSFEGSLRHGRNVERAAAEALPNGAVAWRGQIWEITEAEMSDPRLAGTIDDMWNWDAYVQDGPFTIWRGGFRIENDEGAWQMRPVVKLKFSDVEYTVWTGIFDGEGAYEGLTAFAEVTEAGGGYELRGVVTDGEIPPPPEPMQ